MIVVCNLLLCVIVTRYLLSFGTGLPVFASQLETFNLKFWYIFIRQRYTDAQCRWYAYLTKNRLLHSPSRHHKLMSSQKHFPVLNSKWHRVNGMLSFELVMYKVLLVFELCSALNSVYCQPCGAFQLQSCQRYPCMPVKAQTHTKFSIQETENQIIIHDENSSIYCYYVQRIATVEVFEKNYNRNDGNILN